MKNVVGPRVVEARRTAKPPISQMDLVARLQLRGIMITQSALSKLEHGLRPVTDIELLALAKALHVKCGWLLNENAA